MTRARLELRPCEWLNDEHEGWFVLDGGGNWSSVEGTRTEWGEVAAALEAGKGDVRHRRCAAVLRTGGNGARWTFYSPRNAHGERDYVELPVADGPALAAQIRAAIAR